MRTKKPIILIVLLVGMAFLIGRSKSAGENHFDNTGAPPQVSELNLPLGVIPSRAPDYISVRMKRPLKTLIARETGSFELEARLNDPKSADGSRLAWNPNAAGPVIIWISTPQDSGIAFIDRIRPARPYHHLLVQFAFPEQDNCQPITKKVECTLVLQHKSRTSHLLAGYPCGSDHRGRARDS